MMRRSSLALGLDFGTESVRALLVDLQGRERGSATAKYENGQIVESLPGSSVKLPLHFALQHPLDWISSASRAIHAAVRKARAKKENIISIGVDFTSCTMLPSRRDGTPLCLLKEFAREPLAWPKLWKHHGAQSQTDRLNEVARHRKEKFLGRYGGIIGLEWFFPKVLETLENAPQVYDATEVWLEAGDWFVWRLCDGPAETLPRSTCQAGYKGLWNASDGYPDEEFFGAVNAKFRTVVKDKMPGRLIAPGNAAGGLTREMAKLMGLAEGTPVSAAVIDAHAGVPGAGAAEPGTLVMVLGTSSCHMLNSETERFIPGIAGGVRDGILPGYFGYETGQSAVGDAFDWLRRLTGQRNFTTLGARASALPPGAEGVRCVDWFNGCRTPLMDGTLRGSFSGLALHHQSPHLYRALLEASAFGLRWIVERLREGGLQVKQFVATGGLAHHNPLVVQVYADVLNAPIKVAATKQGPALGAAILGSLAAGAFDTPRNAIQAMTSTGQKSEKLTRPNRIHRSAYDRLYNEYREQCEYLSRNKNPDGKESR